MFTSTTKNQIENGQTTNGAINGAQNQINNNFSAAELRAAYEAYQEEICEYAYRRVMETKTVWGVEYNTIARRINAAKNRGVSSGSVYGADYYVPTVSSKVGLSVLIEEKPCYPGCDKTYFDVQIVAMVAGRPETRTVTSVRNVSGSKNESKMRTATCKSIAKALEIYYDDVYCRPKYCMSLCEIDKAATAAEENERLASEIDSVQNAVDNALAECGYNALKLATALVSVEKQLKSRMFYGDAKAVESVWLACREEILRRLESLGDGGGDHTPGSGPDDNGGTPAPGCDGDGNDGTPAPGLDDTDLTDWLKHCLNLYNDDTPEEIDTIWLDENFMLTCYGYDDDGMTVMITDDPNGNAVTGMWDGVESTYNWTVEDDDDIADVVREIREFMDEYNELYFILGNTYRGDDGNLYTLVAADDDYSIDKYRYTFEHDDTTFSATGDSYANYAIIHDGDDDVIVRPTDHVNDGGDDDTINLRSADGGFIKLKANTNGNPAHGLNEYPNVGDVYTTQVDGVNVMVTGGYLDEYGDWIVTGKLLGKYGPERDLDEVGGMLYYTDDNDYSYRLKRRVDEKKTDSGNYADACSIAKLLAADYEKIYGDSDDLGSYTLGDYILTTTRNEGIESVWMTATLMLTNEAQKRYVLDAHEQWELSWDVEYDDGVNDVYGVNDVAKKIAAAMVDAPQHFFREGYAYMSNSGRVYELDMVDFDGARDKYIATLTDADGKEIIADMDAYATYITVELEGPDGKVAHIDTIHAEDIVF